MSKKLSIGTKKLSTGNKIGVYYISLFMYVIIFSIWDFKTNEHYFDKWESLSFYDKLRLSILIVVHNILFFFIYFTVFFISVGIIKRELYVKLYLGLVVAVLLHWLTNNNRCIFTQWHNRIIGISDDVGFRDFYAIIMNIQTETSANFKGSNGEKVMSIRSVIYYSLICTNILFCLYKLVIL